MSQYLLIVFLLVSLSQAFNVDIYEPIVRVSLQNDDFDDLLNKDMFGYRVALYNSTAGPRYVQCSTITYVILKFRAIILEYFHGTAYTHVW